MRKVIDALYDKAVGDLKQAERASRNDDPPGG